jgi:glycosyltransferase 2 family protein
VSVPDPVPDALPDEVSLRRRVVNVRTLGSLAFGVVLLVLLFRVIFGADFDWGLVGRLIAEADPAFLGLAFVAYYATFPLRSLRWRFVLSRSGVRIGFGDATEIDVPQLRGDVYRAYLLRGNFGASIPRTLGTIFIERIADLIVIAVLALAAGFWSFRGRSRPEMDALFITGFAIALSLLVVVIVLRQMGAHLTRFLPRRVGVLWDRFHEGSTGALTVRSVPVIIGITLVIWILEGARLYFVIRALDLPGADMGISASVFVALAAALLTAIPLTPAGFGFVEAGIVGLLALYGVIREPATAVALTDRALTIVTVIVLGAILYAVSGKIRRAHGLSAAT